MKTRNLSADEIQGESYSKIPITIWTTPSL